MAIVVIDVVSIPGTVQAGLATSVEPEVSRTLLFELGAFELEDVEVILSCPLVNLVFSA